jgi:hypothetical protein
MEKIEVSVNGKTMVKSNGIIANRLNPSTLSTRRTETRSPAELLEIYDKMYLLNTDQELKKALKKAFPVEILDKCGTERMLLHLDVSPNGYVYSVTFGVKTDSPLYDIDMQIYSDLEDIIKSVFRFKIPATSILSYSPTLPFSLSRLTDDVSLFPPAAYRERGAAYRATN